MAIEKNNVRILTIPEAPVKPLQRRTREGEGNVISEIPLPLSIYWTLDNITLSSDASIDEVAYDLISRSAIEMASLDDESRTTSLREMLERNLPAYDSDTGEENADGEDLVFYNLYVPYHLEDALLTLTETGRVIGQELERSDLFKERMVVLLLMDTLKYNHLSTQHGSV